MIVKPVNKSALVLVLLLLAASIPLRAQDEANEYDDEGKIGKIFVEAGLWIAQAAGTEYEPVSFSETGSPFDTQLLTLDHGTESRFRYRAGYEFRSNLGAIVFTWYAHKEETLVADDRPGQYVFGEVLAHPLYAGLNNDGLADGYGATADTVLRDFRVDFSRAAFRSPRVEGHWFIGYRRIQHKRYIDAQYYSILNDLPPLIPPGPDPRPDLAPGADLVSMDSKLTARGLEGGMDFLFPVLKNDLVIEAGFVLAVLRGDLDSSYNSTTNYYQLNVPMQPPEVLSPPYLEFESDVDDITQEQNRVGLNVNGRQTSSDVLEAYLGFRWRAWRALEVFGGFRQARYSGVGVDLRPKLVAMGGGTNIEDVTEVDRSVTYEGFYGGVSFRF